LVEDNFYATIKFKSGEEIFAQIAASEEEDRTMLLVSNPITVEEVKMKGRTFGYKFEPWLKTTKEDMFVIDMENVLTMSESEDMEMICYYQDFVRRNNKNSLTKLDRKMGHLGSVNEAKKSLEKIFNIDTAPKE
tara:strand:+ start:91 stop:492 length:402 start_codon:yes stop_codon:yes gene_type:complete